MLTTNQATSKQVFHLIMCWMHADFIILQTVQETSIIMRSYTLDRVTDFQYNKMNA